MALSTVRELGVDSAMDFRVIGLTGGMGAGKSVVARMLRGLGHPVYDADSAAKRQYDTDPDLLEAVVGRFGNSILDESGVLDRRKLSDVVFSDAEALASLNALVHPVVARDFQLWREKCRENGARFVFREAAILFESGSNQDCDAVWGVSAPFSLRVERIRERSKWSEADILERMSKQWSEEKVLARCDAILINDGRHSVVNQVITLLEQL